MTLKRWIVGLLAVGALSGCGVGLDDPEGQAAAGKQGVVQTNRSTPTTPQSTSKTGAETSTSATVNMGDPYLPQDPVPLFIIHQNNGDPQNPGAGCTTCQ